MFDIIKSVSGRKKVLLMVLFSLSFASFLQADWNTFKYTETRTGCFLGMSASIDSPYLKWEKKLDAIPAHFGDHVHCAPAINDLDNDGKPEIIIGTEECGSTGGGIWSLNGEDGSESWFIPLTAYIHSSSPSIGDLDDDGKLEVTMGTGAGGSPMRLYSFNGEDGSESWYKDIGGIEDCPALGDLDKDGKLEIAVGTDSSCIYALNGEDGSLLWRYNASAGQIRSSPALADVDKDTYLEVIFQTAIPSKVIALNGEDGSILWSRTLGAGFSSTLRVISSPAIEDINNDDTLDVIIGCYNDSVYALNGMTGNKIWGYQAGNEVLSSPAIGDIDGDTLPEVVIGSNDSKIYALNGEDGSLLWSFNMTSGDWIESSALIADICDDSVPEIIMNDWHSLYNINGKDGSLNWSWVFPNRSDHVSASPAVSDVDNDGKLEIIIGSGGHVTEEAYLYVLDDISGAGTEEKQELRIESIELRVIRNKIYLSVEDARDVELKVYDLCGRVKETIYEGRLTKGSYEFGTRMRASGIYFVTLNAEQVKETRKLILIR